MLLRVYTARAFPAKWGKCEFASVPHYSIFFFTGGVCALNQHTIQENILKKCLNLEHG